MELCQSIEHTEEEYHPQKTQSDHTQWRRPISQYRKAIPSVSHVPRQRGSRSPSRRPLQPLRAVPHQQIRDGEQSNHSAEEIDRVQGIHIIRLVPAQVNHLINSSTQARMQYAPISPMAIPKCTLCLCQLAFILPGRVQHHRLVKPGDTSPRHPHVLHGDRVLFVVKNPQDLS